MAGGAGSVGEKEVKIGVGGWVEGRRVVAAVQLVGVRVCVVQSLWMTDLRCVNVLQQKWEVVWVQNDRALVSQFLESQS